MALLQNSIKVVGVCFLLNKNLFSIEITMMNNECSNVRNESKAQLNKKKRKKKVNIPNNNDEIRA